MHLSHYRECSFKTAHLFWFSKSCSHPSIYSECITNGDAQPWQCPVKNLNMYGTRVSHKFASKCTNNRPSSLHMLPTSSLCIYISEPSSLQSQINTKCISECLNAYLAFNHHSECQNQIKVHISNAWTIMKPCMTTEHQKCKKSWDTRVPWICTRDRSSSPSMCTCPNPLHLFRNHSSNH